MQGSLSAPPGELAAWMWSFDCAEDCNHPVPGVEIAYARGVADSAHAWYVEGGMALPVTPYVEAYRQIGNMSPPRGIGVRVAAPVTGWGEYRVFYRIDPQPQFTANTHLVLASGHSPNNENSATFVALIQSFGLMRNGVSSALVPALSFGITHTLRTRYGQQERALALLVVASVIGRLR